jgi:3-oxoacyl-[acyl-carrier-protein] synthase II
MAARRMGRPARFAVAAARMAIESAGLADVPGEASRASVVLGTAFGPVHFTERLLTTILRESPEAAQPALFTECVANAAAAQIAIALGARGANATVTQAEASPLCALARAAREIASGRSDLVLVGAVEEMTPLLHEILGRFGALASPDAAGIERARPFDARRTGFLAGEGATILVVEPLDAPQARNAPVLARITGCGSAFDPTAPAAGWGSGSASLATSTRACLDRFGVQLATIDRVVSGANGSLKGDAVEGRWLRALFGDGPVPPLLAPKGALGEYGGGILAAGVLAVEGASFGPTSGFEEPDPAMNLVPHDGAPLPPASRVLLTSAGSGGAAAWAVLERP